MQGDDGSGPPRLCIDSEINSGHFAPGHTGDGGKEEGGKREEDRDPAEAVDLHSDIVHDGGYKSADIAASNVPTAYHPSVSRTVALGTFLTI